MQNDELRYQLLKLLAHEPQISQRNLAQKLGISVGRANYCLSALADKGWVKINNFRRSDNKLAHAYLLTPQGLEEKARITLSFLRQKVAEHAQLQREIELLRQEACLLELENVAEKADFPPVLLSPGS